MAISNPPNTTSQTTQRNVPGATSGTRGAKLEHLPTRTATHKVQGPPVNSTGKAVSTRSGPPPLHHTGAQSVKPKEQR